MNGQLRQEQLATPAKIKSEGSSKRMLQKSLAACWWRVCWLALNASAYEIKKPCEMLAK
jgi:hypothetical protein